MSDLYKVGDIVESKLSVYPHRIVKEPKYDSTYRDHYYAAEYDIPTAEGPRTVGTSIWHGDIKKPEPLP